MQDIPQIFRMVTFSLLPPLGLHLLDIASNSTICITANISQSLHPKGRLDFLCIILYFRFPFYTWRSSWFSSEYCISVQLFCWKRNSFAVGGLKIQYQKGKFQNKIHSSEEASLPSCWLIIKNCVLMASLRSASCRTSLIFRSSRRLSSSEDQLLHICWLKKSFVTIIIFLAL